MTPLDRLDSLCERLSAALDGIAATAPGRPAIDLTFIETETLEACSGLAALPAEEQQLALDRLNALSTLLARCQSHVETRLEEIDGGLHSAKSVSSTDRG